MKNKNHSQLNEPLPKSNGIEAFGDGMVSFEDIKESHTTSKSTTFEPAERITSNHSFTYGSEYTKTGQKRHNDISKLSNSVIRKTISPIKGSVISEALKPKSVVYKDKKHINCRLPGDSGTHLQSIDIDAFIDAWSKLTGNAKPSQSAVYAQSCGMIAKMYYDQVQNNMKHSEISLSYKRMLRGDKNVIDCADALLLVGGFVKEDPLYRSTPQEGFYVRKYVLEDQYLVSNSYKIAKVYLKDLQTPSSFNGLDANNDEKTNIVSEEGHNNNEIKGIEDTNDLGGCHGHKECLKVTPLSSGKQQFNSAEERITHYRNMLIEDYPHLIKYNSGYGMTFAANSERKSKQRMKNKYGWGQNKLSIV